MTTLKNCFELQDRYVDHTMYQRKVDVDMLNAVKSVLAAMFRALSLRQSKRLFCSDEGLMIETSDNTLFTAFSISTSTFIC